MSSSTPRSPSSPAAALLARGRPDTAVAPTPAPHPGPAAGPFAVASSFAYAARTSGVGRGLRAFLQLNQAEGFDCPGCAWPDPAGHRATFEFCENGARAVAHEADRRRVDGALLASRPIAELDRLSDHDLEHLGRLVEPVVKRPGDDRFRPLPWDEAFALAGAALRALPGADAAAFYTSGRTGNEAAFLYQLFVRAFGTNNLPDCSNMCHESSGKGLLSTLGVGKGTVQLDDFEKADCIWVIGQNPGTNHPRMLASLLAARQRGAEIVVVNPLRERALQRFAHPQKGLGALGLGSEIATRWAQVRINGDVPLLKGVMKALVALDDAAGGGVLDRPFLEAHAAGWEALVDALRAVSWPDLERGSGLPRSLMEELGALMARSERVIACWAMGLTQHENGVDNIREVVNLLLLRGQVGKPGAGACPVRGHSNVQGDRTMGIHEAPSDDFLDRLDAATGIRSPRAHGHDVVHTIEALERGHVQAFVALGGNLVAAAPDSHRVAAGLRGARLTVQIATKLNRTCLAAGETALILPCLGRTELDVQASGPQFVTVEDSMSVVHRSQGRLPPAGPALRSEVAIVCGLARATLPPLPGLDWSAFTDDYDRVRDLIARVVPGFTDMNARVRAPDGFVLPNSAREREWRVEGGRARCTLVPLPELDLPSGRLRLMTVRSHDQFNTTVYANNDRYRGVHGRRDVIFINAEDAMEQGLRQGVRVDLTSHHNGRERTVRGFSVVIFDIPRGDACGYFPELNPLVPLEQRARESHTPASKSVVISVAPAVG